MSLPSRQARILGVFAALGLLLSANPAVAEKVWKYDDGPEDLGTLQGSKMHAQYAHPGFVPQEAFGALFKPDKSDYPITITAIDLLMAAPQNEADPASKKVNAVIEIWNAKNADAKPDATKPLWTVNTADFFNPKTGKPGTPIQGNTVMKYEFKSAKPGDKPPVINDGNIWIMIRITSNTSDYSLSYWSELGCFKGEVLGQEGCGCQDLAALTDSITTPKTQVMNLVWPLGKCSGGKAWKFVEDLTNTQGFTMTGDFRLRMRTAGGGGSSSGGSSSGGSTSGGDVDAGSTGPEDTHIPPAKPVVNLVTPDNGKEGEITEITIIGSDFETGAKVSVGTKACDVVSVTPTQIKAKVNPTLSAGTYPVIVENTNGQAGFKDSAFTVNKKEEPKVDAGADSGGGTFNPGGDIKIDVVSPTAIDCTEDALLTVIGEGFATGMEMEVGGKALQAVNVESATKATGLVPKGLSAGKHSLIAKVGGKSAVKVSAVEVRCEEGGCAVGPQSSPGSSRHIFLVLGLAVLALVLRRRAVV